MKKRSRFLALPGMTKLVVFGMTIAAVLVLSSCGNKNAANYVSKPQDTASVVAFYKLPDDKSKGWKYLHDVAARIGKDTSLFTKVDGDKYEKRMQREFEYYIPIADTIKENGLVVFDTTGKAKIIRRFYRLPKDWLIDATVKNLDSVMVIEMSKK